MEEREKKEREKKEREKKDEKLAKLAKLDKLERVKRAVALRPLSLFSYPISFYVPVPVLMVRYLSL